MASHEKELLQKIKKDVRSVLITESGGMLLEDFMKVFKQLTNSTIPYRRLGYRSVEELLLEAADVCRCQRLASGELHLRPVCDQSTSHVLKMVERSRKPKSASGRRAALAARQRGQRVPWLPGVQLAAHGARGGEREPEPPARCRAGCVPPEARTSILQLLARHPQGIHLDEFNHKHRDMHGSAITYIGLGFYSVKGMLESIPDLVRLKETPTGDKAFPIPAPGRDGGSGADRPVASGAGDVPSPDAFLSYEDSVRGLSEQLRRVISAQAASVKVSDVLNLYLREFGHSLSYVEYGFSSLLGALASLGAPFHLEKQADDWHVSVRRRGERQPPPTAAPPACGGGRGTAEDGPPPLAGLPPARFSMQRLCCLEEDGQQMITQTGYPLLEVVVTHVKSPDEFFFRLEASAPALSRLEADLEAAYGGPLDYRSRPPVHDWQLTAGQPLAARVAAPAAWRRALLLGRVAEHVKVYLVDWGSTHLLPLDSVRPLHHQFLHMPALAHEGALAAVLPQHGIWSRPALRLFSELVGGGVILMATVLTQSQFVSTMLLCDTRGDTDVHVGDELLSAKLADKLPAGSRDVCHAPLPLVTPASRMLDEMYTALGGGGGGVPEQQSRMPPDGAEPQEPDSQPHSEAESCTHASCSVGELEQRIAALKIKCYDARRQWQAAPMGPRRAALHSLLLRLEAQLEPLLTSQ